MTTDLGNHFDREGYDRHSGIPALYNNVLVKGEHNHEQV
jgi:hypothetical protein